jgi:hypothetical protein
MLRSSTWLMRWSADCPTHHAAARPRNAERLGPDVPNPGNVRNG